MPLPTNDFPIPARWNNGVCVNGVEALPKFSICASHQMGLMKVFRVNRIIPYNIVKLKD